MLCKSWIYSEADGFGDRAHSQLMLPGVEKGNQAIRAESAQRSFWFQIGRGQLSRVLVADNPIEALSLSALDKRQGSTVYLGGSESDIPKAMLKQFAQQGGEIYVAHGNSSEGEQRAWELAKAVPQVQRRRPLQENWTNQLQNVSAPIETQDWLRVAKALEHSERYVNRVREVSPQATDAKAPLQRDMAEFKRLQNDLWSWHNAARDTGATPVYLGRISEIAIAFNAAEPTPLSADAKSAMSQVIGYHTSQKMQAQAANRGLDLEAG